MLHSVPLGQREGNIFRRVEIVGVVAFPVIVANCGTKPGTFAARTLLSEGLQVCPSEGWS